MSSNPPHQRAGLSIGPPRWPDVGSTQAPDTGVRLHLPNGVPVRLTGRVCPEGQWVTVTQFDGEALCVQLFEAGCRRAVATCTRTMPDAVQLDQLRVVELAFQRRGMGTLLVQALLEALPTLDVRTLRAWVTAGDRRTYPWLLSCCARLGFRWDSRTYTPWDDVPVVWTTPDHPEEHDPP